MAPKFKLTYFDLPAAAEPIRYLFHYGGIEFIDYRLPREQWPSIKPTMPLGQLRILEIEGKKLVNQSHAIARYVAKLVNLAGKDDYHALLIDAMVDNINDMRLKISAYWYEKDENAKKSKYEPLIKEWLPFYLEKFEQIAKENNGYFVEGELSRADIYFAAILDNQNDRVGFNMIEKYPNLIKVRDNVHNIPNIRKYLDTRQKTAFFKPS